ncbi:helix-turn-helix domain-containing protein [Clostridium weizhouense]|uniref:Helix-turn-helix domain-containing protein n=1 Tax=Clostridium weizhouense TaxID=2859781 RepID=A0ABS7AIN0_9CLOT|nr:helix-turn-helix domain-containing protein [Clostridium weizhouense]MBW6408487.1 helix-turn-helix domain-containing protein [Clostridium weizhouense]
MLELEEMNICKVIEKAVKTAIKEYDKEQKSIDKKRVFHNTKLLMKHYNDLKSHIIYSISDINDIGVTDKIELEKEEYDELYILSIKQSKVKTLIMISHVDSSLEILKKEQRKKGVIEKYLALEKLFIDEKTYETIAEELNCGVITVRRWVNEMLDELGIYLFGIEGIKLS